MKNKYLKQDIDYLKNFGLTKEEIDGYIEYDKQNKKNIIKEKLYKQKILSLWNNLCNKFILLKYGD